jgi:hypothetical protein
MEGLEVLFEIFKQPPMVFCIDVDFSGLHSLRSVSVTQPGSELVASHHRSTINAGDPFSIRVHMRIDVMHSLSIPAALAGC